MAHIASLSIKSSSSFALALEVLCNIVIAAAGDLAFSYQIWYTSQLLESFYV